MVTAQSIVFVSLFLGLSAGTQQVEVAVDPAVAAVELRLDGTEAARMIEPPWTIELDLGCELAPHRAPDGVRLVGVGDVAAESR